LNDTSPVRDRAISEIIQSHQNPVARNGLGLTSALGSRGSRFGARISSKIIADIRLGHQTRVNYNCYNEPYADSFFSNVLRHAWLNLLSKHITAGRINQVTEQKGKMEARERASTPPNVAHSRHPHSESAGAPQTGITNKPAPYRKTSRSRLS
jgi:hypothetical protein